MNLRCLIRHHWETYQHSVNALDDARVEFVIAWKQCRRCAKSKLLHILR